MLMTALAGQWTNLVALRDGALDAPLFTFSGTRCEADELGLLAERIRRRPAVVGVEFWKPAEAGLPPPRSLPDMAASALASITRLQPRGPYLLAGYSYGGLVAFEVAQRLQASGASVRFLGLIDAPYSGRYWPRSLWFKTEFGRLMVDLGNLFRLPAREGLALIRFRARRLGLRFVRRLRRRSYEPTPRENVGETPRNRCELALFTYRPQPYSGPVVLFKSVPGGDWYCDLTLLWRVYVTHLETRVVPSDHFALLTADGSIDALAREVNRSLDALDAARPSEGM